MFTPSAPAGDPLEDLIALFLRTVPQAWTEYDVTAFPALAERAMLLLTSAGLIERRISLRLQMFGHPVVVEATIAATGECGLAEAMEYVSARMWDEWREVFEMRKAGDQKDAPAYHCERIGKEQWRLTVQGLVAKDDLDNGRSSTVFDFVLMRGFFDGTIKLMPDGRISGRQTVRGRGKLEKMTVVNPNAAPTGVSIANWDDGVKAFAPAFAELVKSHATKLADPADELPDDTPPGVTLESSEKEREGAETPPPAGTEDHNDDSPLSDRQESILREMFGAGVFSRRARLKQSEIVEKCQRRANPESWKRSFSGVAPSCHAGRRVASSWGREGANTPSTR